MRLGRSHDPENRRYRSFRIAVKRARAQLELSCLQRINLASIDKRHWAAAAWILKFVIGGKYLACARAMRPELSLSVSDIARTLDESHPELFPQNGNGDGEVVKQIVSMSSCLTSDRISVGIRPQPIFKQCEYCEMEFPITGYRQKYCSVQCRLLEQAWNNGEVIGGVITVKSDHQEIENTESDHDEMMMGSVPDHDSDPDNDPDDRFMDPFDDGGDDYYDEDGDEGEEDDGGNFMGGDFDDGFSGRV
jgi:hypothetical protein